MSAFEKHNLQLNYSLISALKEKHGDEAVSIVEGDIFVDGIIQYIIEPHGPNTINIICTDIVLGITESLVDITWFNFIERISEHLNNLNMKYTDAKTRYRLNIYEGINNIAESIFASNVFTKEYISKWNVNSETDVTFEVSKESLDVSVFRHDIKNVAQFSVSLKHATPSFITYVIYPYIERIVQMPT